MKRITIVITGPPEFLGPEFSNYSDGDIAADLLSVFTPEETAAGVTVSVTTEDV